MSAGYLGVSVFFTLSGFLITTLLMSEQSATGRVSLGRFYSRRAKRLLPASLLCLVLVAVARSAGEFDRVDGLRRDGYGALLQSFNWVRLAGTTSYADLFAGGNPAVTSPLEHYWSLAIEEQFYLVWPLVLLGLLTLAKRQGWSIVRMLAVVATAFAIAAPVIAHRYGGSAAYWSTPARLAEILIGGVLAAWIGRRGPVSSRAGRFAVLPLLAVVALASALPSGSGPAYQGLLPVYALFSAGLIYTLQAPGRVRALLSTAPFVASGRVSYGLYLFHWPIFVLLRNHGWDLATVWGFAVAASLTVACALMSYVLIEQPIRHSRWKPQRTAILALLGAATAFAVIAIAPGGVPFLQLDRAVLQQADIQPTNSLSELRPLQASPLSPTIDSAPTAPSATGAAGTPTAPSTIARDSTAPAATTFAATATTATTSATATTATTAMTFPTTDVVTEIPSRPVRILVVGDSTAALLGQGIAAWSVQNPTVATSSLIWNPGLGFILDGTITTFDAANYLERAREIVYGELPMTIRSLQPDVVVLMTTVNDIANRKWSDSEGPLAPSDPAFRGRMTDSYRAISAAILDQGVAHVVWIVPPRPAALWRYADLNDPLRYQVQHDVIGAVVAGMPGRLGLVDLARWAEVTGSATDPTWRPDGVHMSVDAATVLAQQYLGAMLVQQALR